MNELAKDAIADGQTIRPFYNYIAQTFDGIQGKKFRTDELTFNDRIEFYHHLKGVIETMIANDENSES